MKHTFLLRRGEQYDALKAGGVQPHEWILCPHILSRYGEMSWEETSLLAKKINDSGQKCVLQWDILMTENVFSPVKIQFKELDLSLFQAIRVQDPGVLAWLKQTQIFAGEIHIILENGNHNLLGLSEWHSYWPEKVKRLVLSPELTESVLQEVIQKVPCSVEILGIGPLLLFYSPRQLLSPLYGESPHDKWMVYGTSEESPHKDFPILENKHGTFMFNTKDQFLWDDLQGLKKIQGPFDFFLRWDLPYEKEVTADYFQVASQFVNDPSEYLAQELKKNYPVPTSRGFFKVNKTNVLFKKLKNNRLQNRDETFIGEIIEVKKKSHMAFQVLRPEASIKRGQKLLLLCPEGREKKVTVSELRNSLFLPVEEVTYGEVGFCSQVGGVSTKTMIYSLEEI